MPYNNERKVPDSNKEDAMKIMEMVWHQEVKKVTLSDGRTIWLLEYGGRKNPNLITQEPFRLIHPEPLENLVFALLEHGESFIIEANGEHKICGAQEFVRIPDGGCGSNH